MLEIGLTLLAAGVVGGGLFAIYKWGGAAARNANLKKEVEDAEADSDRMRQPLATDDDWAAAARDNLRRSSKD